MLANQLFGNNSTTKFNYVIFTIIHHIYTPPFFSVLFYHNPPF